MRTNETIDLSIIEEITRRNTGKPGALITILQEVQDELGYLPEIAMERISELSNIPASKIYGVVTFYSQFSLTPKGKYVIKVCEGTACHVSGAQNLKEAISLHLNIPNNGTTEDNLFTLESVACLGCCSLAPAVMINEKVYGRLDSKKIIKIIDEYKGRE